MATCRQVLVSYSQFNDSDFVRFLYGTATQLQLMIHGLNIQKMLLTAEVYCVLIVYAAEIAN